jgi:hypothetical protein
MKAMVKEAVAIQKEKYLHAVNISSLFPRSDDHECIHDAEPVMEGFVKGTGFLYHGIPRCN